MPLFLKFLLTIFTLAFASTLPEGFEKAFFSAWIYYVTTMVGDFWSTQMGLKMGLKEGNPLYRKILRDFPWGFPIVSMGILALLAFQLQRLGFPPTLAWTTGLVIGGNAHLVGFLWNLGFILDPPRSGEGRDRL